MTEIEVAAAQALIDTRCHAVHMMTDVLAQRLAVADDGTVVVPNDRDGTPRFKKYGALMTARDLVDELRTQSPYDRCWSTLTG